MRVRVSLPIPAGSPNFGDMIRIAGETWMYFGSRWTTTYLALENNAGPDLPHLRVVIPTETGTLQVPVTGSASSPIIGFTPPPASISGPMFVLNTLTSTFVPLDQPPYGDPLGNQFQVQFVRVYGE